MKRFSFSLDRMLRYKRSLYEEARNELARLRAERAALEQRRDETRRQLLELDVEFRRKAAGGVQMDEVNAYNYYRQSAEYLIEQLGVQIAAKEVEIERQLEVVVQLDKDVKSLEKLREKKWEEYQAEAAREESERILELVSNKFVESQKENNE